MAGNIATSLLSTTFRGTTGISATPAAVKPAKTLKLYDIEVTDGQNNTCKPPIGLYAAHRREAHYIIATRNCDVLTQ